MRRKLTPEQAARAAKLQGLGVFLEFDSAETRTVIIRQSNSAIFNRAFEMPYGRTGFIIEVSILPKHERLAIKDIHLDLPWPDSDIEWLADPAEVASEHPNVFCFPGTYEEFPSNIVLNGYLNSGITIKLKVKGLLLGFGSASIPAGFKHGMLVPATLTIIDQSETEHSERVELVVQRGTRVWRETRKSHRKPIFTDSESEEVEVNSQRSCSPPS